MGGETNNLIRKTGACDLTFDVNAITQYYGVMSLEAGKTKMLSPESTIGWLSIFDGAGYSMKTGSAGKHTYVGEAVISGAIEFDVDMALEQADMLQAYKLLDGITGYTGKVYIEGTSKLFLNMFGTPAIQELRIPIIEAEDTNFQDMYTKGYSFGNVSNNITDGSHPFKGMTIEEDLGAHAGVLYVLEYSDKDVAIRKLLHSFPLLKEVKLTHNQTEVMRSLHNIHTGQASGGGTTTDMFSVIENRLMPLLDDIYLIDKVLNLKGEEQVLLSYDEAPLLQALDELSGSIIANGLKMGAIDYGRASVLERIRLNICEITEKTRRGIWAQGFGQGFNAEGDLESPGDFKSSAYGANLGADLLAGKNWLAGIYAGYTAGEMKQWDSKGIMNELGAGIYGGYFEGSWEFKGKVFGGQQKYNIDRKLTLLGMETQGEFDALTIKGSMDLGYKIELSETLELKPFIGAQAGYVKNDQYLESGSNYAALLKVYAGDYTRIEAQGGAGLEYKKNKWELYARGYAGYLITGSKPTFKGEFAGSGEEMEIWGIAEEELGFGAGVGGEYEITKSWSVYTNAAGAMSGNSNGYYANLGIAYRFCNHKKSNEKPVTVIKREEPVREEPVKEPVKEEKREEPAAAVIEEKTEEADTEMETAIKAAKALRSKPLLREYKLSFNFASGKYNLSTPNKEVIKAIAEEIKRLNFKRVVIEGHTDNTGSYRLNKALSKNRARVVAEEFMKNGIPAEMISYEGFSYTMPVDTNATATGRLANRRTEVLVE
jgi:outer membrane protein OmpA-like peptidoglycan-associated protein